MPPTIANGKICYIEMPSKDVAGSESFYARFRDPSGLQQPAVLDPSRDQINP